MKLKLIKNERLTQPGQQRISIAKKGVVIFSKALVEHIGIQTKDQINFYQDEENPTDWFFEIIKSPQVGESEIRQYTAGMITNCKSITETIRESLGVNHDKTIHMNVGAKNETNGKVLYPLLTTLKPSIINKM